MFGEKLDTIDDKLFHIADELNTLLNLGLNIEKMNHTDLVISLRESVVDVLKIQKELEK